MLYQITDFHDEQGQRGERFAFEQVGENFLELRNNDDHQERDDRQRHEDNDRRVNHGRDDLVLDLLGLFLEIGETTKRDIENTARLTSAHHVDVEAGLNTFGCCANASLNVLPAF